MQRLFRTRSSFLLALVSTVAMLAIGFLPLFAGPGYESSLAAGLILPSLVAVAAALEMARFRPEPFDGLSRGIAMGACFAGLGYAMTFVHGLRTGFCGFAEGSLFFVLGPGIGSLLGGAWGTIAGEVAGRFRGRRLYVIAVLFALFGPLATILIGLYRFYSSPIIFAFDPFVGFFSGALYDTVVSDTRGALLTYRLRASLSLLALAVVAAHLARTERGGLRFRPLGRPGILLLGSLSAVASLGLYLQGPALGHYQTASSIDASLGGKLRGKRCDLVYSRSLGVEQAKLFLRDCDAQVEAVERYFQVCDARPIRAYLFRDPAEKRRLMGAANTYIAKPWRREVYVQANGFPHPVLGHEIAHVVSGSFTEGPFHVGGGFLNLRANPGLVEGIAVAASPDEDDDLTPAEWSRAMLDLGILPKLGKVFAFGFFGEGSAKSYTVAGAFVGYVHDRFGAEALRRWYRGESLEALTGESLSSLEGEWHRYLASLEIADDARAVAEARFDRPSVFFRSCPHEVDALRADANAAFSMGDLPLAQASFEKLLALDPSDIRARFQLVTCRQRAGEERLAEQGLEEIAEDSKQPRLVRDRALTQMADLALANGDIETAKRLYEELRARSFDEDRKRTLDVKLYAVEHLNGRDALVAYLIGTRERGVDALDAAAKLGRWAESSPNEGLPDYLLARSALSRGLYRDGAASLDRALEKGLHIASVRKEAKRLRIVVACANGDSDAVSRAYADWREEGDTKGARGESVERLVARCE